MKLKAYIAVSVILFSAVLLTSCGKKYKYDSDWIIGKNSQEIIEQYGEFDVVTMPKNDQGLYSSAICSYIIVPKKVGYLGTTPERLFSIGFDENGIADEFFEETGGKGG